MNKFFRIFMMTTMAFTVFACGKDEEPAPAVPELKIASADLSQLFTGEGGTKTISVTANAAFTAVSDQDWCTITNLTYGTQSFFTINVAASTVEEERTAKVTVSLTGATSIEIAVTQEEGIAPRDFVKPTGLWTVAKPGTIEWYTWTAGVDANDLEGTPSSTVPPIIDGPGDVKAWALTKEDHIKVYNPLTMPTVDYTIMWDVKINELSRYIPLLQPVVTAGNPDAAIFLRSGGSRGKTHYDFGFVASYSDSLYSLDTWYRIVAVVNISNGTAQMYVDGEPIQKWDADLLTHVLQTKTGMDSDDNKARFTLSTNFYLFLDDDGEDGPIDCAGFAAWDQVLTADEVKALGTVAKRIY